MECEVRHEGGDEDRESWDLEKSCADEGESDEDYGSTNSEDKGRDEAVDRGEEEDGEDYGSIGFGKGREDEQRDDGVKNCEAEMPGIESGKISRSSRRRQRRPNSWRSSSVEIKDK